MAAFTAFSSLQTRSCFFVGTRVPAKPRVVVARPTAELTISARYRGNGTDLSKTEQFRRHDRDSGSAEYQIARLSARVVQLTRHLSEHKKDFATRRGLLQILGQRKQLLAYLQRTDKDKYQEIVQTLNIRVQKAAV
ncbi:hypothetical protein N2152v2_006449 [Parachlorella kessleri]